LFPLHFKKLVKNSELSIYYQNVRSLVSKIDKLISTINTNFFDIIAFSETWLSNNLSNSEINFNNYIIYRCDRSLLNSNCIIGDEVLIAVNYNLKSKKLHISIDSVEHVFVQL
jgi:hypothetical protein